MDKKTFFLNGFVIALVKFILMPIVSAILIVAGFFTEILATFIGVAFLVMYLLLCVVFGARVAAASAYDGEEEDK